MNDNQKVMRVHVSEDKSFKVSAKKKKKKHYIVGNRWANILHVATSFGGAYRKKRNVGPDWKEAHQTRGLIIYDSRRKPISVIVSLYIFLCLRLSLYSFDTYEMNSLTACLNSFLFLKCSFFGSLSVSIQMISLPSAVRTPAKKKIRREIACIYIKTERHTAHKSKA